MTVSAKSSKHSFQSIMCSVIQKLKKLESINKIYCKYVHVKIAIMNDFFCITFLLLLCYTRVLPVLKNHQKAIIKNVQKFIKSNENVNGYTFTLYVTTNVAHRLYLVS